MAGCRFTSSAVNDTGSIFQRDLCASTHAFSYLESVQKTGKTRETSVNTGIFRVYTYFEFLLNKCYSLLYIEPAAMFSKIQNTSFYKLCANTILNKRETIITAHLTLVSVWCMCYNNTIIIHLTGLLFFSFFFSFIVYIYSILLYILFILFFYALFFVSAGVIIYPVI